MATYLQIDPESLIDAARGLPTHGRGAWSELGIGDSDDRYHYRRAKPRVGDQAEDSLHGWAVSAGVGAIQERLVKLGHLTPRVEADRGRYGSGTRDAVKRFQESLGWKPLGIVGHDTSRALWTPLIDAAQRASKIPENLLRGQLNMESGGLDPGAVGWYIFYPDYRGVDRGLAQVNSRFRRGVTWLQAYDPTFVIPYAGKALRATYDDFTKEFGDRSDAMRWDAAICAHNSPKRARAWLLNGYPSAEAAKYVSMVKGARY